MTTESKTQTKKVFSQPDRGSLVRLLKQSVFVYLRPYWKAQIVLAITVLLSVLFEIALPLSLKFLIDSAIVPQDGRQLILILGGIGLLFAISSLGGVVQAYVRARFGGELLKDLRINLFTNLQDLPTRYFDRTQPGEFTAFFAKELLTLQFALRDLIVKGFYAVLKLGLTVAALLVLDWRLTLAVAIVLPFTAVLPHWAINRAAVADYADKYDDAKIASAESRLTWCNEQTPSFGSVQKPQVCVMPLPALVICGKICRVSNQLLMLLKNQA